jgi:hypothetical protein
VQTKYPHGTENRVYDIFEEFGDGAKRWRISVVGMENAESKLRELAKTTSNKLIALSLEDIRFPKTHVDPAVKHMRRAS